MATTSTVVPGGDLAGRSAEYRRGYVAGWLFASGGWLLCLYCVLCTSFVGAVGLWSINTQRERADRAEAHLAEMRARGFTVVAPQSARDGDVVMLRWDGGAWRPMSARLPLTGGTITGQNLQFGTDTPAPGLPTPPPPGGAK